MNNDINSPLYTIPYIFILIILIFLSAQEKKGLLKKEKVFKYCVFIFVVFFCFRGYVGWDWMNYYPIFLNVDDLFHFSSSSFIIVYSNTISSDIIEPGFIIYVSLLKTIWFNWHFFVIVTTIIPVIAISLFIKNNCKNYAFAFAIFFSLYPGLIIDLMRNALSLSVFLFSLTLIKQRKLIPFLIISIVGFSFHRTFISLVPLYFVYEMKIPKWLSILIFVICNIIFIAGIPVVTTIANELLPYLGDTASATKVNSYLNKDSAVARGLTLGYFVRFVVFCLIIAKYKVIQSDKNLNFFLNSYLIYIFITIGMSDMRSFVDRMEYVYCFPFLVLYPYYETILAPRKRILYLSFIYLFCFLKLFSYTSSPMLKYETMFNGKTFEEQYKVKRPIGEKIVDES